MLEFVEGSDNALIVIILQTLLLEPLACVLFYLRVGLGHLDLLGDVDVVDLIKLFVFDVEGISLSKDAKLGAHNWFHTAFKIFFVVCCAFRRGLLILRIEMKLSKLSFYLVKLV